MTVIAPPLLTDELIAAPTEGQWAVVWRRLRRHPFALVGAAALLIILLASLAAPLIAPFPYNDINLDRRFLPPLSTDPVTGKLLLLGSDHLGRDFFTRLLYAARVSLLTAIIVATVAVTIGVVLGLMAGYFGGWIDTAIRAVLEFVSTFPTLIILLILTSILLQSGGDELLPNWVTVPVATILAVPQREAGQVALLIATLSLLGWTGTTRLMRAMVLGVREQLYIESARSLGGSPFHIISKHVFPNAFPPLIVDFTLGINGALVAESALSFLGYGIKDPTPTWGNMLAFAQSYMFNEPWMPLIPGLPILICSLAINYLGDGLRDALDPRARH